MSQVSKKGFALGALVFMFIFMPFSSAQTKENPKEEGLTTKARLAIYKAQTAMSEDKPDEALEILDKYIAAEPSNVPLPVYELIAYIWLEKEDLEKSRKYFKIIYDTQPDDPKVLRNYASLTFQTGQYAEAAILFEQLYKIEEATTPGGALPHAVQAYMLAEDLVNAKRILKRLVRLPSKADAQWYKVLINICMEREEMKEAEQYIIDLLHLDPIQARYWKYLAQIRMKGEEWQTATSDMEISYRIEVPKNKSEWKILGDLYTSAVNAPLMGARCFHLAYKDNSAEKSYVSISRVYQRAYRYNEAVKTLDEGLRKNPMSTTLLLEKGQVLYEARRYKEAITALEECVKIDPKSGDAYFQMGLSAWTLKDWDLARTAFVQAKRLSERYQSQCNSVIDLLDNLNEEKAEVEAAK